MLCESVDWFLYNRDLRHERVYKIWTQLVFSSNINTYWEFRVNLLENFSKAPSYKALLFLVWLVSLTYYGRWRKKCLSLVSLTYYGRLRKKCLSCRYLERFRWTSRESIDVEYYWRDNVIFIIHSYFNYFSVQSK